MREPPVNYTRIVSVQILADWYPCDTVGSVRVISVRCGKGGDWTAAVNKSEYYQLADPDGIINGELLAIQDDGVYLPAGMVCKVHLPDESQDGHYELIAAGVLCQCGSGAGSEEEGSEEEGSGPEGSEQEESGPIGSGPEGSAPYPCYPAYGQMLNWPVLQDDNGNSTAVSVLGIDANGCLGYVPIVPCGSGSGGS